MSNVFQAMFYMKVLVLMMSIIGAIAIPIQPGEVTMEKTDGGFKTLMATLSPREKIALLKQLKNELDSADETGSEEEQDGEDEDEESPVRQQWFKGLGKGFFKKLRFQAKFLHDRRMADQKGYDWVKDWLKKEAQEHNWKVTGGGDRQMA